MWVSELHCFAGFPSQTIVDQGVEKARYIGTRGHKSLLPTSESECDSAVSSHCSLYANSPSEREYTGSKIGSFSPTTTLPVRSVGTSYLSLPSLLRISRTVTTVTLLCTVRKNRLPRAARKKPVTNTFCPKTHEQYSTPTQSMPKSLHLGHSAKSTRPEKHLHKSAIAEYLHSLNIAPCITPTNGAGNEEGRQKMRVRNECLWRSHCSRSPISTLPLLIMIFEFGLAPGLLPFTLWCSLPT